MRSAFAQALIAVTQNNPRIFVITNDLGYSVLEPFIEQFPQQYLNIGIAEQNMIGVAAGLALSGKLPIVFSIIPFTTMRCYEQIRNDICYHNLNVKIVGAGSGLAYGSLGPSHHAIEDIAIMRVLPQMTIICPGDPVETDLALKASLAYKGPVYIRIHKKGDPTVHTHIPDFTIGKAIEIKNGKHGTLITTGNMLPRAVNIVNSLKTRGMSFRLLSMHTIKPLDINSIKKSAKETGVIFTIEEHSIIGGLGGAVAETLAELNTHVLFRRIGIQDRFTKEVGTQNYLLSVNALSVENIVDTITRFLRNY